MPQLNFQHGFSIFGHMGSILSNMNYYQLLVVNFSCFYGFFFLNHWSLWTKKLDNVKVRILFENSTTRIAIACTKHTFNYVHIIIFIFSICSWLLVWNVWWSCKTILDFTNENHFHGYIGSSLYWNNMVYRWPPSQVSIIIYTVKSRAEACLN